MTSSELVSRFLIPQSILHLETHSFPHRTQSTTLCIVKLQMCLPQENDPKFRAFAKHLCLLRAAVFRGVGGEVQIGDQRKISLLSNDNCQSSPLPDRVKMDFPVQVVGNSKQRPRLTNFFSVAPKRFQKQRGPCKHFIH